MTNQYLYRIQPTRAEMLTGDSTEDETRIISEHFNYLQALCKQGVVLLAGRTLNTDLSSFGIIIFKADTEEAAQALVQNDPAVSQGVMSAELFPYRVAVVADSAVFD